MTKSNLDLTDAEWSVLLAVWQLEPCPAPTVREALVEEKNWAYSTVKTLMDRMKDKGILKAEKVRNLIFYSSAVTPEQARKSELFRTVKRAFDGAFTPMMQFMLEGDNFTEEQLDQLEKTIQLKRRNFKPEK